MLLHFVRECTVALKRRQKVRDRMNAHEQRCNLVVAHDQSMLKSPTFMSAIAAALPEMTHGRPLWYFLSWMILHTTSWEPNTRLISVRS